MDDFKDLWITFAIIGLVLFCIIAFVVQFQTDNNQDESILDNPIINKTYGSLGSNLSSFSGITQGQKDNFEAEVPTSSFGSLVIFSIVSSGKILNGMITGIYNILIVLPAQILGINEIIIGVFSSILIVSIILLIWRLIKNG